MKAVICTKYGPPDTLKLEEVPKPTPGDNEVLVEVHAASVNYSTVAYVTGKPFGIRFMGGGLLKPKHRIPGAEVAGRDFESIDDHADYLRAGGCAEILEVLAAKPSEG